MTTTRGAAIGLALLLGLSATWALAQRTPSSRYRGGAFPRWEPDPELPDDVFTFVRLRFRNLNGRGGWRTDFPEADLNLSFRLQQVTSLKVHPDGAVIDITPEELADYPFVYMLEVGNIDLSDEEAAALREYLLGGGFLMVDDFWGERSWRHFYSNGLKKIFPDREPIELELDHAVFQEVFQLKEKPQILAYGSGVVHYWGVFDDQGRMMMIVCHNTDLGDAWEWDGSSHSFLERAIKRAYPMAINIIVHAMTH